MKDERFLQQVKEIRELREYLDTTGPTFPADVTKRDVQKAYGRKVSRTTWGRWCEKCSITQDLLSRYNGKYPAGAYLLLMINARLLRGSGPKERRRKVTRETLAIAVKRHRQVVDQALVKDLPSRLNRDELIALAEAQAGRTYHPKSHERLGIKRSKKQFNRSEALDILQNYPSFVIGA